VGGAGLFADQRAVGALANLWCEDDESTFRRTFTVIDLPVDAPLSVTCALASGYRWAGSTDDVACQPAGWSGSVTIHPAPPRASYADVLSSQVEVRLRDGSRIVGRRDDLEERGIIVIGGSPGDAVSLNPQPLPPREDLPSGVSDTVAGASSTLASARLRNDLERTVVVGGATLSGGRPAHSVSLANETSAVAAAMDYVRSNPEGNGTVRGIDFRVVEAQPEIIR
jgi:hypothetical protein